MELVDTHAHLDFRAFDEDREAVIVRAVEAGLVAIVNPGTDLESSRAAVALAERYPHVYAAVGIHPTSAHLLDNGALAELRRLAAHPKVVAIGEIGLDDYWPRVPDRGWRCATPEEQRRAFRAQLDLAADLDLPVIIHDREAHDAVLALLEAWVQGGEGRRGVLHSFSGDEAMAHRAVEMGFYIGITGPVTFKKAEGLRRVVATVPMARLLVETDAPFLTPHPYRGRRNEPAHVRFVVRRIAEVRSVSPEMVASQTTHNATALFRRLRVETASPPASTSAGPRS